VRWGHLTASPRARAPRRRARGRRRSSRTGFGPSDRFYSDREVKVIAALLGAIPDDADELYLPVGEGATGRHEHVGGIAILRRAEAPADSEAYRVDERPQWDRGGETVARIAFVRRASGLSREEFADHWPNVHSPLSPNHPPP